MGAGEATISLKNYSPHLRTAACLAPGHQASQKTCPAQRESWVSKELQFLKEDEKSMHPTKAARATAE